jgi:hypothetical protein
MQWPREIVSAFARGMEVEPEEGWSQEKVILAVLDETARRTVWRCQGDPSRIRGALRWPYTPLGSVVPCGLEGWAKSVCLHGPLWGEAVDALYEYMEKNAQAIFESFKDEAEPYDDMSS